MTKIGILSDTHGFIDERLFKFWEHCDEIWHAGDIGSLEAASRLQSFKPLRAVYGNIDGTELRSDFPKFLKFNCENTSVLITHIGGYPNNYAPGIVELLKAEKPKLFITGHSHILKVMFDKKNDLLFINPGAAGNSGFHKVKTAIRLSIDNETFSNLEIWESPRG